MRSSDWSSDVCSSDLLGDLLDQARLLDLEGNLRDDDLKTAALRLLGLPARPQAEGAPARPVGLDDARAPLDQDAAGREVGPRHEVYELVDGRVRRLDDVQQRIADIADVMRRDRRRPAAGDSLGAGGQQIGKGAGQDDRVSRLPPVRASTGKSP